MILINLLPHRELARKKKREQFYANMGVALIVGLLIVGGIWMYFGFLQMNQDSRNDKLKARISQLDTQLADMNTLEQEIQALMARQRAVEDLQSDRNLPVHWLEDLGNLTPPGIYLTSVTQKGLELKVSGVTINNERFGDFIQIISGSGNKNPESAGASEKERHWIMNPGWREAIVSVDFSILPGEPVRRMYTFGLEFDLRRERTEEEQQPNKASDE